MAFTMMSVLLPHGSRRKTIIQIHEVHRDEGQEVAGFTGLVTYTKRPVGWGTESKTYRMSGYFEYTRHEFCMNKVRLTLQHRGVCIQLMLDSSSDEVARLEIGYPMGSAMPEETE